MPCGPLEGACSSPKATTWRQAAGAVLLRHQARKKSRRGTRPGRRRFLHALDALVLFRVLGLSLKALDVLALVFGLWVWDIVGLGYRADSPLGNFRAQAGLRQGFGRA